MANPIKTIVDISNCFSVVKQVFPNKHKSIFNKNLKIWGMILCMPMFHKVRKMGTGTNWKKKKTKNLGNEKWEKISVLEEFEEAKEIEQETVLSRTALQEIEGSRLKTANPPPPPFSLSLRVI